MQKIRYFDISWLSKLDGPGSRLVVFFQGCNLKCPWCHSPHSWNYFSPILLNKNRCQFCGACETICANGVHRVTKETHTLNSKNCTSCGKCIEACIESSFHAKNGALLLPTREAEVSELFHLIYPQLKILKKIGGITLSGGEALLQQAAAKVLLQLCKEHGIHTAVESSGFLPLAHYNQIAELVDYWLLGIRGIEESSPQFPTLYETLQFLSSVNKNILIRFPIVCGYTDAKHQLAATKKLMQTFSLSSIQLLPYNKNTSHYYNALDIPFSLQGDPNPSDETLKEIESFFQHSNIKTI